MAIGQHKHSHDKILTEIRNSQTLFLFFFLGHLPAYTTSRLYAVEPWRWTSPSFQPPRNWSPNFCQPHVRVYMLASAAALQFAITWHRRLLQHGHRTVLGCVQARECAEHCSFTEGRMCRTLSGTENTESERAKVKGRTSSYTPIHGPVASASHLS